MIEFPGGFLWGAATSAYQVEGNNIHSDWWQWEKSGKLKFQSGKACLHYELYKEDFNLAKSLHHNAHRISIEWSRIEPAIGQFNEKEIDHYKQVILELRRNNIEPIVTLHHFTNPAWFTESGGWLDKKCTSHFIKYVEKLLYAFGDKVKYWITINEPFIYSYYSYIEGTWPPQVKSFSKAKKVLNNLALTHIKTYRLIHEYYKANRLGLPLVSIAKNMQAFMPCIPSLKNILAAYLRDRIYNHNMLAYFCRKRTLDFIGVNYYSRSLVEVGGLSLKNILLDTCQNSHSKLLKNSLGWDIYPEGLFKILCGLKCFGLPVLITENGICTEDDNLRWSFIHDHLYNINLAVRQGVKVMGYIYWSLIDNFEWDKGFGPRFGLVEVDYATLKRKVRESAYKYSQVCKTNKLD
ncbi:MAG: glycoside hydrolase family 1 protein [Candidatus Omnitrophota bacterium]|jgi:beta-glucosidase|nr:MAG: glycoside hydrolase family 1 protein [Candidatus Omnitrophota bacterium]